MSAKQPYVAVAEELPNGTHRIVLCHAHGPPDGPRMVVGPPDNRAYVLTIRDWLNQGGLDAIREAFGVENEEAVFDQ